MTTATKSNAMDATTYDELLAELQPVVDKVVRTKYGDIATADYQHTLKGEGVLRITARVFDPETREVAKDDRFLAVNSLKVISTIENVVWVWCLSHPQYVWSRRANNDRIYVGVNHEDNEQQGTAALAGR